MLRKPLTSIILLLFSLIVFSITLSGFKLKTDEFSKYHYSEDALDKEKKELDKVLTKLYNTAGLFHHSIKKPEIAFVDTVDVAEYNRKEKIIIFSNQLLYFLLEKKEEERSHFYFHILGHELGHHYYTTVGEYPNTGCHKLKVAEYEADVFGVFISMLAGQTDLKDKVPSIINILYADFIKKDGCRPLKETRKEISETAINRADSLHHLFQLANYLTAAEEYESAIEIYNYLLDTPYKGAEFYNNRGILNTLKGIQENYDRNKTYKRFFFPLELDLNTKLYNVKDEQDWLTSLNNEYFEKAIADFDMAIKLGGNQEQHFLNKCSALILKGDDIAALDVLKKECIGDRDVEELLKTIILAKTNPTEAIKQFNKLAKKEFSRVSQLAEMNMAVLKNSTKFKKSKHPSCIEQALPDHYTLARTGELQNISGFTFKDSDYQYGWSKIEEKGKCFIIRGKSNFSLQEFESIKCNNKYAPSSMGINFITFDDEINWNKIIILQNGQGALLRH